MAFARPNVCLNMPDNSLRRGTEVQPFMPVNETREDAVGERRCGAELLFALPNDTQFVNIQRRPDGADEVGTLPTGGGNDGDGISVVL